MSASTSAVRYVPLANRDCVHAVWCGPDHVGFIRHDVEGRFIARTTGNAASAADMRIFLDREKAGEWLAGTVDGIRPRTRRKALVTAGLLALCLASPGQAKEPADPYRNWAPPVVATAIPAVPVWQSPPPNDLLNEVVALRPSCAKWRDSETAGFASEAHVCAVLAGSDPACINGKIAGSWMTAAGIAGAWLLFRLLLLAPMVRRARTAP